VKPKQNRKKIEKTTAKKKFLLTMDKMIGFLSNTLTTTLYNNNSIIDYNHHIPLFLTFMFFFFCFCQN